MVFRAFNEASEGMIIKNFEVWWATFSSEPVCPLLNAAPRVGRKGEIVGVISRLSKYGSRVGPDPCGRRRGPGRHHVPRGHQRAEAHRGRPVPKIETDNAPVFGVDVNGKIAEWNGKAVEVPGYSKEATLGKPLIDGVHR